MKGVGVGVNVGMRSAPLLNTAIKKKHLPVHSMKLHALAAWPPEMINRLCPWAGMDVLETRQSLSLAFPSAGPIGIQRRSAARSCPATTCLYLLGTV